MIFGHQSPKPRLVYQQTFALFYERMDFTAILIYVKAFFKLQIKLASFPAVPLFFCPYRGLRGTVTPFWRLYCIIYFKFSQRSIITSYGNVIYSCPRAKMPLADQLILALVAGILLFFLVAGGGVIGFEIAHSGKIFPGISVGAVDLSGLTPAEATARVTAAFTYPQTGQIFLQDGKDAWQVSPADLGLYLDPESSVTQAYEIGRKGNIFFNVETQFRTWKSPVNLSPVYVFDQRRAHKYLTGLAAKINKPVVEASVGLNGIDVQVRSGQTGRELDVPATLERISAKIQGLQDGVIQLVVIETKPVILDASAQAELARQDSQCPARTLYAGNSAG